MPSIPSCMQFTPATTTMREFKTHAPACEANARILRELMHIRYCTTICMIFYININASLVSLKSFLTYFIRIDANISTTLTDLLIKRNRNAANTHNSYMVEYYPFTWMFNHSQYHIWWMMTFTSSQKHVPPSCVYNWLLIGIKRMMKTYHMSIYCLNLSKRNLFQ